MSDHPTQAGSGRPGSDPPIPDAVLKARHRAMWALGDYPVVAADLVSSLGPVLVDAAGVKQGDRVLDVAAGSGNAAIPAALTGATVVASDLTPELLEAGRRLAEEQGVDLEWREADAEALPFADQSFDAVLSCVGVMFAPHHRASAKELLRVTRPGGKIGLISWTPEGFIGQLMRTMSRYSPPPPPGAQPPVLWGDATHVKELLGDRVEVEVERRQSVRVEHFSSGDEFRDYFKANFGPTIAAYRFLGGDPERAAELDQALVDLAQAHDVETGVMEWEYLLLTGSVR